MKSRLLIALCGAPKAGKSEVQTYLRDAYGVVPVDDGYPLRDFATRHLGLGWDDVSSQAGKARTVTLPGGRVCTVREVLGEFGNKIEELLGPDAIPEMALHKTRHVQAPGLSFGSARRKQGSVFKRAGGIVVEIRRPGAEIVHDFDWYDPTLVDLTINNDADLATLRARVDFNIGQRLNAEFVP